MPVVHLARRTTEATDKDVEKLTACRKYGITLISVPTLRSKNVLSLRDALLCVDKPPSHCDHILLHDC
jgi:hypothetical protein